MKHRSRIFAVLTSAGFILALAPAAAQQDPGSGSPASTTPALKNDRDRLSYAVGANLARHLRSESVDVDYALVSRGIRDALSGAGLLMSEHEISVIVNALENDLQKKKINAEAERIVAANALAEKNKKAGEAFLAENKKKEGIVTLDSGLQYRILKPGDGKRPALDDTVVCHYRAAFIDGTEFDSSYKSNKPVDIPLKGVIKGWSEALQLMPVGSKWQLFIPPALAYGERGTPKSQVGPNATLIFEVDLLSIRDKLPEKAQAKKSGQGAAEGVGRN